VDDALNDVQVAVLEKLYKGDMFRGRLYDIIGTSHKLSMSAFDAHLEDLTTLGFVRVLPQSGMLALGRKVYYARAMQCRPHRRPTYGERVWRIEPMDAEESS
jgi:hypothetical protein